MVPWQYVRALQFGIWEAGRWGIVNAWIRRPMLPHRHIWRSGARLKLKEFVHWAEQFLAQIVQEPSFGACYASTKAADCRELSLEPTIGA